MTNLDASSSQLDAALQTFRQRWEQTKSVWLDEVSRNFESQYCAPLDAQTQATQREMGRLAQVIARASTAINGAESR